MFTFTVGLRCKLLIYVIYVTYVVYGCVCAASSDDKILEITCLGKFTGSFHNFIYVAENETDTNYYVIRTAWRITYTNRIKRQLRDHKLWVFDHNPTTNCGWTLLSKITNVGIYTGNIYRKNNTNRNIEDFAAELLFNNYPTLEILIMILIVILYCSLILGCCSIIPEHILCDGFIPLACISIAFGWFLLALV